LVIYEVKHKGDSRTGNILSLQFVIGPRPTPNIQILQPEDITGEKREGRGKGKGLK
jgi:hypothetical protein